MDLTFTFFGYLVTLNLFLFQFAWGTFIVFYFRVFLIRQPSKCSRIALDIKHYVGLNDLNCIALNNTCKTSKGSDYVITLFILNMIHAWNLSYDYKFSFNAGWMSGILQESLVWHHNFYTRDILNTVQRILKYKAVYGMQILLSKTEPTVLPCKWT